MSTTTTRTWSEINTGDVVVFGPAENVDNHYTVQAIGSVIDGGRSVVLADTNDGNPYFYEATDAVETIPARVPARPLIDFGLARYATAREYAAHHVSRANKPETNTRLRNVVDGQQVDAYALNEALVDAMRGAATRAGQSRLRRIHGKEIAHLAHIVQAVLESHADGLPVYAEGDRSRAVEDMKEATAAAHAEVERLVAVLAERDANFERAIIEAADAEVAWSQKVRDLSEQAWSQEVQDLREEVSKLSLVLGYTRGLGTAEQSAQSLGYQHGLEKR